MIALDTNVLVRALTDDSDNKEQAALAVGLIKRSGQAYVTQVVQVEFFWVLERAYKLPKKDLVQALQILQSDDVYVLQRELSFQAALRRYQEGSAGFADSLIAAESQSENVTLWTFDRKLSKQPGVVRLATDALAEY